ncbi:MAG TPA: hypothetical protein VGD99_28265 [Anaerolineae bacterium]|jgi:hypothetical protein
MKPALPISSVPFKEAGAFCYWEAIEITRLAGVPEENFLCQEKGYREDTGGGSYPIEEWLKKR